MLQWFEIGFFCALQEKKRKIETELYINKKIETALYMGKKTLYIKSRNSALRKKKKKKKQRFI